MPLFWIVHQVNGESRVYIKEASAPIYARLQGRLLSQREAKSLLKKLV